MIDREEAEFGLTMPACGALVARALKERLDLSDEEWTAHAALLTQRSQRFAVQNPDAHLRAGIERGAPVSVERQDDRVLVNRMPVRKFYTRTINGLVELAGSGWKRLTGKG